jgi:hypothetical protein
MIEETPESRALRAALEQKITTNTPLNDDELFQYAYLTKDTREKHDPSTGHPRFTVIWFDAVKEVSGVFYATGEDGIAALQQAEQSPALPNCVETTVFPGFLPENLRFHP